MPTQCWKCFHLNGLKIWKSRKSLPPKAIMRYFELWLANTGLLYALGTWVGKVRRVADYLVTHHYVGNFMGIVVVFDSFFTAYDIDSRAAGIPTPSFILALSDLCLALYTTESLALCKGASHESLTVEAVWRFPGNMKEDWYEFAYHILIHTCLSLQHPRQDVIHAFMYARYVWGVGTSAYMWYMCICIYLLLISTFH